MPNAVFGAADHVALFVYFVVQIGIKAQRMKHLVREPRGKVGLITVVRQRVHRCAVPTVRVSRMVDGDQGRALKPLVGIVLAEKQLSAQKRHARRHPLGVARSPGRRVVVVPAARHEGDGCGRPNRSKNQPPEMIESLFDHRALVGVESKVRHAGEPGAELVLFSRAVVLDRHKGAPVGQSDIPQLACRRIDGKRQLGDSRQRHTPFGQCFQHGAFPFGPSEHRTIVGDNILYDSAASKRRQGAGRPAASARNGKESFITARAKIRDAGNFFSISTVRQISRGFSDKVENGTHAAAHAPRTSVV